jgi:hypothetical protein
MDSPRQVANTRRGFLRNWLISFARCGEVLSPDRRAEMKKALVEHLKAVDESDQRLAAMAANVRDGGGST